MGAPTTASAASNKIAISIDGKPATVGRDSFLLPAVRALDIYIPTLCFHKDLTPTGTCRLCLVEVEVRGRKRLVTSCNYPVREELRVETRSPRVLQHRKMLAEMYLGRWPNVPVVKEIAARCGVTESRFRSELTDENPKACILCGHCVRACEEFIQEEVLDFAGRGIKRHLTMPYGEVDPHCVGCTSCAFVCPTGAIEIVDDLCRPVDPKLIQKHGMKVNAEMATLDRVQNCMRKMGTANIVQVMDKYDLLPCHNYKFGSHKDSFRIDQRQIVKVVRQDVPDGCWKGCSMSCAKAADDFALKTGPYAGEKVLVDAPEYETAGGTANMGCFDLDFMFEFAFYCDTYGIDVISASTTIAFVMECFEAGVINESHTGGKKLRFGALRETLELLHEMARGEGFGVEVGQGIRWLKNKWTKELGADPKFLADIGMEVKGLEVSEYMAKESLAQQAGYAMAVKGAQHDEAWLIFMDMVNNQIPSFEDKANALYYFPLWRTWFGLMGLCKLPWNDIVPADNKKHPPQIAAKIPEHVENYFKLYEGVTGQKLDEETMLEQSARVHNLQRLLCYLLGGGTRETDMPPYRLVGPVTREEYESRAARYDKQLKELCGVEPAGMPVEEKMTILRRYRMEQYNKVVDAAYRRRGWDGNGVPTPERLEELGIDIPEVLALLYSR